MERGVWEGRDGRQRGGGVVIVGKGVKEVGGEIGSQTFMVGK